MPKCLHCSMPAAGGRQTCDGCHEQRLEALQRRMRKRAPPAPERDDTGHEERVGGRDPFALPKKGPLCNQCRKRPPVRGKARCPKCASHLEPRAPLPKHVVAPPPDLEPEALDDAGEADPEAVAAEEVGDEEPDGASAEAPEHGQAEVQLAAAAVEAVVDAGPAGDAGEGQGSPSSAPQCRRCRRVPARPGLRECEACAAVTVAMSRAAVQQNRAKGLCRCGRRPRAGRATCKVCAAHQRAFMERRRQAGMCMCGQPAVAEKGECAACASERLVRHRARRESLRAAGTCIICGSAPSTGGGRCDACRTRAADNARAWRARRAR